MWKISAPISSADLRRWRRFRKLFGYKGRQATLKGAIMATQDRIEMNPKVMLGKPVIRGTRVTVEIILRKLGEGATHQDLLEAYPNLTERDIHAAITYAAETLAHEETVLIEQQG
jgi:uncharacterized protein (DUF433 family)